MLNQIHERHVVTDPLESPIFVMGTGRSGTTLLRQMLNAHPNIYITHEACFYSAVRHAPKNATVGEWLERYFETFSFAWLRLDPEVVKRELGPEVLKASAHERIDAVGLAIMRCKAAQLGRSRFGEKNPLDTDNLARIFKDYEDPRVIYITRDPRPTVHSFNRMPFGTSSALINSWLCRIQFQHIQPYLSRILEVRLEDLTANPRAQMQSILNFVGESWDDSVLHHLEHSVVEDVPPLPWFVGATREQPNQKTSDGGWQRQLDPAWIRIIEQINQPTLSRYGYEPASLEREPGFWKLFLTRLRDLPRALASGYRLLAFKRKLDRHFQNIELLDPQQGMEENVALNPDAWRYYPKFVMPRVPPLGGHLALPAEPLRKAQ